MADLTPNNREEHWLQGMVDGQTTLEPNKRREYWYKEIVDAIGSGGGGGGTGGGSLLIVVADEPMDAPPSWVPEWAEELTFYETNATYSQFHTAFGSSVIGIVTPASANFSIERKQQRAAFVDYGLSDGLYMGGVYWFDSTASTTDRHLALMANSEDGALYAVID